MLFTKNFKIELLWWLGSARLVPFSVPAHTNMLRNVFLKYSIYIIIYSIILCTTDNIKYTSINAKYTYGNVRYLRKAWLLYSYSESASDIKYRMKNTIMYFYLIKREL